MRRNCTDSHERERGSIHAEVRAVTFHQFWWFLVMCRNCSDSRERGCIRAEVHAVTSRQLWWFLVMRNNSTDSREHRVTRTDSREWSEVIGQAGASSLVSVK